MSWFTVTFTKTMLLKIEAEDYKDAEEKARSMEDEYIEQNGAEIGYPWDLDGIRQIPD